MLLNLKTYTYIQVKWSEHRRSILKPPLKLEYRSWMILVISYLSACSTSNRGWVRHSLCSWSKRIIFLQKKCFCNREISWSMQFPAWMLVHLCYPEQKSNKDPSKTLEICKKVAKSYQVPSPAVLTIPGRNGNFATSGFNRIHLSPFTSPAGISFFSLFEAFLSCMSPTQNHIPKLGTNR